MHRYLVLLVFLAAFCSLTGISYSPAEPDTISSRIVELIDISQPLYLEVQAGDLTTALDLRIRELLIQKGADLRELNPPSWDETATTDRETLPDPQLEAYSINSAHLVKVSTELDWTTLEQRSFFFYRSERRPLYTFQIKQIALPANRLLSINSLSFVDQSFKAEKQSSANLKWFEPVLAVTALGSIIYLLWTTE